MAVKSRPRTAAEVAAGARANDPFRIRNSAGKPLRPGRPSDAILPAIVLTFLFGFAPQIGAAFFNPAVTGLLKQLGS